MNSAILKDFRSTVDSRKAVLSDVERRLSKAKSDLKEMKKKRSDADRALLVLQTVSKATQEQLEYRISELVSLALESVFDDPYKLELKYEVKRNKTEAILQFERGGQRVQPINASGGGVVDIAAFALRVSLWSLAANRSDNVLVLDEPFRFVSKDLLQRTGQMLKEISKELGLQIIMVTHLDELIDCADKVFKVTIKNRVSIVEEV